MAEAKESKILIKEDNIRSKLLEGAKEVYEAVSSTYGPRGKNVLLEKGFGRPILTRDGITVARDVYFSDRAKNMGSQLLIEASEATQKNGGDGTSGSVVLGYHLLKNSIKAVAAGKHPMEISDTITKDSRVVLEALEKLAIPVKDDQLKEVATVSAGDPLIGQLIAEAILYVGPDGGILTEKAPINEVEREYIDGYYLQSGFTALQAGKKELINPQVVVSSKRIASASDVIEILNVVSISIGNMPGQPPQRIPKVLFIGNFEDAAYNTIVENINRGTIDAIVIKTPPMFGELGKYLLEDIALYADCKPITDMTTLKEFDGSFVGSIDKVISSKHESTLFADNQRETIIERVKEIKKQIETEVSAPVLEKLRDRVAKLEGKIAIFKIGGVTDTAKEELEFRIEDAINSTRHAHAEGIVAGGGVTLLELSKLDVSDLFKNALQSTFKQLLINANLPAELKLDEALRAPKGKGYNLREGGELVDVIKAGVIDPIVVVREVVKNSSGLVASAITIGTALIFEDTKKD